MMFREISPGQRLKPYIKCFYFYESQSDHPFDDIVFPSGNMEVIFNLGEGTWKTKKDGSFITTPAIELWGQITGPLAVRSTGRNVMLGARFYPHSAAYFFNADVSVLNNDVVDGVDLFGASIKTLHTRLTHIPDLAGRVACLEEYLWSRLAVSERRHDKIRLVGEIADSLIRDGGNGERIMSVSVRNRISTRYLNRLFSQYTGLTPKLYCKINRFQRSLNLINSSEQKLTAIGYDSGYFDQSHFIRDFKLFTGITPTSFSNQTLPINQLVQASLR